MEAPADAVRLLLAGLVDFVPYYPVEVCNALHCAVQLTHNLDHKIGYLSESPMDRLTGQYPPKMTLIEFIENNFGRVPVLLGMPGLHRSIEASGCN